MADAPNSSKPAEISPPPKASPPRAETNSPPIANTVLPAKEEAASLPREDPATVDAASPKSWTIPSRSKTASPTGPGSPPAEQTADDQGDDTAAQQAAIEVDQQVHEATPIPDDQLSVSAYTKSLSSSVVDYPTEHGRRYHAFRHGAYYGPNDETELDRLDFLSDFVIKMTEGQLYHAQLDPNKVHRILDVGTGTGIWAVQIADEFPNAEVIGNDLSPVQTEWVPPNVKFEVDDVESPWIGPKYDFIFSRGMAGAIADWPQLVRNVFENTNPGGWAEFQDWDTIYYCDDGTCGEDTFTMKMDRMFIDACKMIGRDPRPGPQLEGWLRDAGFINICHKMIKIPIGTWPKDERLKDLGHMNLIQIIDGLEAYNLRLFTSVLGWTQVEAQVLFAEVRREMKSNLHHSHMQFHLVYGQVPEAEAE
ncbi:Secondary metabolism regulator LAE1 [Colletotrichum viniferum]|nr:Secondary metabolism regulator LAE1 [Colletotrichum viniferum]